MAVKRTKEHVSDTEVRRLLKQYHCKMPFHAVRTFFLGGIASPKIDTRPMQMLQKLWDGEMPEFESIEDANELIRVLINGFWNGLTRHQSSKHPFRLADMRLPADEEGISRFGETRIEELEAFVDGFFQDEEMLNLPESARAALRNLGELRSFFAAFVQFANDHQGADAIDSTVRKMQELSVIASKEINTVILSCVRSRRTALEMMMTPAPTRH